MILDQINKRGFSDIIKFDVSKNLYELQHLIYLLTKKFLTDHDNSLNLVKKLQIPFKSIPSNNLWSEIMNEVNSSKELKQLINDNGIKKQFKNIFKKPKIFPISFFRARFPEQKRVIYNWHQDEGTWGESVSKEILNKFPITLWFSINGSNKKNSIQLVKNSHKFSLLKHSSIEGQGYFNAELKKEINDDDIYTVETNNSEGIFFTSHTLHRSALNNGENLKPRYSVDIRYFEDSLLSKIKNRFI